VRGEGLTLFLFFYFGDRHCWRVVIKREVTGENDKTTHPSTPKTMANIPQGALFSWNEIEAASDLQRLLLVLRVLPDEKRVRALERRRGHGRNDYPIRPCFNALIAGVVFNHPTAAALLRELRRNAELRQVCGFDPHAGANAVPPDYVFSRFLTLLMDYAELLEEVFHALVEQLRQQLPQLGQKMAVDSKAIASFGNPVSDEEKRKEPDGRRDLDADWGTKTYRGQRSDGSAWEKSKRWFGFKLHLLVDSVYEMPLAYEITEASASDATHLLPLVDDVKEHHPDIAEGAEELSADKGYDSADNKSQLYDDHGIKPVIDNRNLWKDAPDEPRLLFPERADVFLESEKAQVFCQCPSERRGEEELRELAFVGFEKDRQTLKYRCPAA
jgi:hypothetical protein